MGKTTYSNKESEGERAIVQGHHETQSLQGLIDKFIEKYVLCRGCQLPEIDMVVNKKGFVVATCKACGWSGELDNDHKLATYISKHPPSTGIGFDAEKGKGKKEKKEKRGSKTAQDEDEEQDDDEEPEKKEKKEKKEKHEKKEKKDKKEKADREVEADEDKGSEGDEGDEKEKKE